MTPDEPPIPSAATTDERGVPAPRPAGAPGPDPAAPAGTAAPTAAPSGPGVVRRTTSTVKRVMLVAIGALVALFAVFNSQNVEVRWIFGQPIETPLILALAVTFIAGVAIGWLTAKLGGRNRASQP